MAAAPWPPLDCRYLVLTLTSRCNLRCRYCYLAAGEQGSDMEPERLNQALALVDHGRFVHIQLTGGEPTLVPRLIRQVGERSLTMAVRPSLGIQTNGTQLDDPLIELMASFGMQVGVSLDGPFAVQEQQRGQAAATLRGLQLLEAAAIPFQVTTVVTRDSVASLDRLVLMLAGFRCCRGVGLDLLVRRGRGQASPPTVAQVEAGITAMARTLRQVRRLRAVPFHLREEELLARQGGPFCRAATGQSLAVLPDGSLYTCSQTQGDPEFSLGHLDAPHPVGSRPRLGLESASCLDCPLEGRCPGDCPSRLHYHGGQDRELICALYRSLARQCGRDSGC